MVNKKVIPEGTRDLVFKDCKKRSTVIKKLEDIYNSFGYEEVITPTIEYYKTFFSEKEVLKEEEVYKFFDGSGRILALRPDMTIPIARVVGAKMRDIEGTIRLRYCSNVFNVNKTFGGKRNEYTDCGIELIGESSLGSDLEALVLALEGLKSLEIENFKLEIGNINFFNTAFDEIGLKDEDREKLANLIETKSLIELKEFLDSLEISEEYKEFFNKLPWLFGDKEILDKGLKLSFNKKIEESLNYMKDLYKLLDELGYGNNITFDLGMVPRVNYYTGIIFKGYLDGVGDTVLSGGRYDNLISDFGRNLEAIGFSVNVDLVAESMVEVKEEKVVIINYGKNKIVQAIKESEKLRKDKATVKLNFSNNKDLLEIKRGE